MGSQLGDILHRLPNPVPAVFVDGPDVAMPFDCDGLDETDPAAMERYAAEHGLDVVYEPDGIAPDAAATVHWVYWRDQLLAYAPGVDVPGTDHGGSSLRWVTRRPRCAYRGTSWWRKKWQANRAVTRRKYGRG